MDAASGRFNVRAAALLRDARCLGIRLQISRERVQHEWIPPPTPAPPTFLVPVTTISGVKGSTESTRKRLWFSVPLENIVPKTPFPLCLVGSLVHMYFLCKAKVTRVLISHTFAYFNTAVIMFSRDHNKELTPSTAWSRFVNVLIDKLSFNMIFTYSLLCWNEKWTCVISDILDKAESNLHNNVTVVVLFSSKWWKWLNLAFLYFITDGQISFQLWRRLL